MQLGQALDVVRELVPGEFGHFQQHIDDAWIAEALASTGTATLRRRRLPAEQVVWLVIGMALMRNDAIDRVVEFLDLALPSTSKTTAAKSGIAQARQRLGDQPLQHLFTTTAEHWVYDRATKDAWRGLKLFAMDGTTVRVPDTPENWAAFGGQTGTATRGGSTYPQIRLVALMAVRSHMLAAVRFGHFQTAELTMAEDLWDALPEDSLAILDRNYLVSADLTELRLSGRNKHWLTRAKTTTKMRRIKKLGKDDDLVEIELSEATRRLNPDLPATWVARAIGYQRRGYAKSTLLTSLVDHEKYPAKELVAMYHERWEIEVGYDEVKTHLLDRHEAIRSRNPVLVQQEIWGIVLAYNLVRLEMCRAADELGISPNRISFVSAVAFIVRAWLMSGTQPRAPGAIPPRLFDLRRLLKMLVLPPRRPERVFPRRVKIKMSNYERKRPVGPGRK